MLKEIIAFDLDGVIINSLPNNETEADESFSTKTSFIPPSQKSTKSKPRQIKILSISIASHQNI